MSSKDQDKNRIDDTITYVYVPDDEIYGIIKSHGAYSSLISYQEDGIGYEIEVSNDEFIVVDEIEITYIDETEENL